MWTTQAYLVSLYLSCPSGMGLHCPEEADRDRLRQAVRRGDVDYHAFPFNAQPELCDAGLFAAGFELVRDLDRELLGAAAPPRLTMSQRDVPGLTRGALEVMVRQGVKVLSVGVNGFSAPPAVPRPGAFVWRAPASGADVVAFWHAGGYGGQQDSGLEVSYAGDCVVTDGFAEALCFAWRGDNAGPPEPEEVLRDFAVLRREFPQATVRASTFDAFAHSLLAAAPGLELPVVTAEIGDSWINGAASDPLKSMRFRALQRARARCLAAEACAPAGDPAVKNFTRLLLNVAEHTWGTDIKKSLSQCPPDACGDAEGLEPYERYQVQYEPASWSNQAFRAALAKGAPEYVRTVDSWKRQRAYLDWAVEALPAGHGLRALVAEELAGLGPRPPGPGFRPLAPAAWARRLRLGAFEVQALEGEVALAGLWGRTAWASRDAPLFALEYATYTEEDYDVVWSDYAFNKSTIASWSGKDFGKPGSGAHARQRAVRPRLGAVSVREGADGAVEALLLEGPLPEELREGAGGMRNVSLLLEATATGGLAVTVAWRDKRPTRLPEAVWLRLGAPAGARTLFHKLGGVVEQRKVLGNGSRIHAVGDRGVSFALGDVGEGGLQLDVGSLDAPLAAPDGTHPLYPIVDPTAAAKGGGEREARGAAFCLSNNVWGTNYVMWTPIEEGTGEADAAFRFVVREGRSPELRRGGGGTT